MGTRLNRKVWAIVFATLFLVELGFVVAPVKGTVPISVIRSYYATSKDGFIWKSGANYVLTWCDPMGTVNTGGVLWFGGQLNISNIYTIYRGFIPFDTSGLPDDAVITNATLSLYKYANATSQEFNLTVQGGTYSSYPAYPLTTYDYYFEHYDGDGGSIDTSTLTSGYNNITLNSYGRSLIRTTGITQFVLRSDRDIMPTAPNDTELVMFWSSEHGAAFTPLLTIGYTCDGYEYLVNGAYSEDGVWLSGTGVNVTLTRDTESPVTIEVDGQETFTSETRPILFEIDVGYNESRVIYVRDDYEEIMAFLPNQDYRTYYFELYDGVGIHNGYLETLVNVNGTDWVVERRTTEILGQIPFIMSWGVTYKMRVICDEGIVYLKPFIAGQTTSTPITIDESDFPFHPSGTMNMTVTATRHNETWISVLYDDPQNLTLTAYVFIYEFGSTTPVYNTSFVTQSLNLNFYDALNGLDYLVYVVGNRTLGSSSWTFTLTGSSPTTDNPWTGLDWIGDLPFPVSYLPAIALILLMLVTFSYFTVIMGLISAWMTAMLMAWIGWLPLTLEWQIVSGVIMFMMVLSIGKTREPTI